jgi:hypothetical protein
MKGKTRMLCREACTELQAELNLAQELTRRICHFIMLYQAILAEDHLKGNDYLNFSVLRAFFLKQFF